MEGPCADSVEKREPASDLAIVVVDSLKRLTPTGRLEKRTPDDRADHCAGRTSEIGNLQQIAEVVE